MSPPITSWFQSATSSLKGMWANLTTVEPKKPVEEKKNTTSENWSSRFERGATRTLKSVEKTLVDTGSYTAGALDGLNPLTPLADKIGETLHLKRAPELDNAPYWKGRQDGSALGMAIDAVGMTGGTGLSATSVTCAATTAGICTPLALPGAGVGVALAGASAGLLVLHGEGFEKAKEQYVEARGREASGQVSKNQEASKNSQAEVKREATPSTDKDLFEPVRGTSAKRNKETGEIWERDMLHKDHYEVYKNLKMKEKGKRERSVWEDGRFKEKVSK